MTTLRELPSYLLKPLPKARVKGHLQTMVFIQLRHDTGAAVEYAICENITATRTYSQHSSAWTKWFDRTHADFEAAKTYIAGQETVMTGMTRRYFSHVEDALMLPLNETDVRHLRAEKMLPRQMLEYGHDLYDAIAQWCAEESKRVAATSASGLSMTATGPAPAPAPAPGAASPASPPPAPGSLSDALEKLGTATTAVKGSVAELDKF